MGQAFQGSIPEPVKKYAYEPGAAIFTCDMDSWSSWAVMYITKSEVSHVALSIGNGQLCHVIPHRGVVVQSITSLYGQHTRLIVVNNPIDQALWFKSRDYLASTLGEPYSWKLICLHVLGIPLGLFKNRYRWQLSVDTIILIGLANLICRNIFGQSSFIKCTIGYLLFLGLSWKFLSLTGPNFWSPGALLSGLANALKDTGGIIIGDGRVYSRLGFNTYSIDPIDEWLKARIRGWQKDMILKKTTINISDSQVAALNVGEKQSVGTIAASITTLRKHDQAEVADAFQAMTEAIGAEQTLPPKKRTHMLDQIEELSRQAAMPPAERAKVGVLSALTSAMTTGVVEIGHIADAWNTWGPIISTALGVKGPGGG